MALIYRNPINKSKSIHPHKKRKKITNSTNTWCRMRTHPQNDHKKHNFEANPAKSKYPPAQTSKNQQKSTKESKKE
jgi:hypothetical protein